MRIKHFLNLKEEKNQEIWSFLTRYNLVSILYNIHNSFRYMISNKTIKTDSPTFKFYYEDVITYTKQNHSILNLRKVLKKFTHRYYKINIKIMQSLGN